MKWSRIHVSLFALLKSDERLSRSPPDDEPDPAREHRGYRIYPGRRPKGRREALIRETVVAIEKRYRVRGLGRIT